MAGQEPAIILLLMEASGSQQVIDGPLQSETGNKHRPKPIWPCKGNSLPK
jgi:hypothetical protein